MPDSNKKQVGKMQKDIEKAFQQAVEKCNNSSHDSDSGIFDQGVKEVLPQLFNDSFTTDEQNYVGVEFNPYKILKKIGSGGMGDVYLAKRNDGQFNKNVAIKILTKGYNNKNFKQRFLQEKQILAQLRHVNIVPLLDAGETEDGIPWFVLEYIEGETIVEFIKKYKPSINEKVQIFIKICDALNFAHNRKIIHRDIKPSNILIEKTENGYNPVILDFGIAQQADSEDLTAQGSIIGTPGFMSPEQLKRMNKNTDQRSDIFSLGAVMYQVFTGIQAFKAENVIGTEQKTLYSQPKKITKILPLFPRDLQTIINKCLKKQVKNRYLSALELKHDLENWQNGYPISAKKESILGVFKRLIKRNKLMAATIGVFFIFALLSFIQYTYKINQQKTIAIKAKQESDDLLNYLLKDLNQELTEIGRVDLLDSVAQKSLKHFEKFDQKNTIQDINHALSYRNIAHIFTMQEDLPDAQSAYQKATLILQNLIDKNIDKPQAISLMALSLSDISRLQAKKGQLKQANKNLTKSIQLAEKLTSKDTASAATLWSVYIAYIWNQMESGKYKIALTYLNKAMKIIDDELKTDKTSDSWLNKRQKTLTAFAWYSLDMREIKKAEKYYLQAQQIISNLLMNSPDSVPLLHDLQKSKNQLAYSFILEKNWQKALSMGKESTKVGEKLHTKAPNNMQFYRELAYAYSVMGESYQGLKRDDLAETFFSESLKISQKIVKLSPDNTSLKNDLAIDMYNFGKLLIRNKKTKQALSYWQDAENTIANIASQDDASMYYINTYVGILLIQGKNKKAQPYLMKMKNSRGWAHKSYLDLVANYKLNEGDINAQ